MRIEVDSGLEKLLGDVKKKEPSIYGRGHVETVRFLANYYMNHRTLNELANDFEAATDNFWQSLDERMETSLERVFPKALAQTISNILTLSKDGNQPEERSAAAARQPGKGR